MLARMPWRVWNEWILYHQEEPFGQMPLRLGFAAAGLGGMLGERKDKRQWSAADFMPDRERTEQSTERSGQRTGANADAIASAWMSFAGTMGIPVVDKRKAADGTNN